MSISSNNVAIVIPTYNEADNIPELFSRLADAGLPHATVVVVDDNSPDGTAALAERTECVLPVTVIRREGRRGLGAALAHGMRYALAHGAEVVITMDADLSHAPEALHTLVHGIERGADVVVGSRRVEGGSTRGWSAARNTVSRIASRLSRTLLSLRTQDVTSGLRAYRASYLRTIDIDSVRSRGYLFQVEMIWRAEHTGHKVSETAIHFVDRQSGTSKLSLIETASSFFSLLRLQTSGRPGEALFVFIALALPALAFRLLLAPQMGSEYDLWAFGWWARASEHQSIFSFFVGPAHPLLTFPNYALYFPFLKLMGAAATDATAFGRVILKLPSIIMDLVLAAVLYRASLAGGIRRAAVVAAFFLFNPVAWYTSAVWGQNDVFHTACMVLSVLALADRKFSRAWLWAVAAILFKLQALMLLPLIAAVQLRTVGFRRAVTHLVPASALAVVVATPYAIRTSVWAIIRSFFSVVGRFPNVTVNVWNPWMLMQLYRGNYVPDSEHLIGPITWFHIGFGAYVLAIVVILYLLPKHPRRVDLFIAAALLAFAFYLFPTEMHERYLYPFIAFAAFALFEGLIPAAIACVISVVIFLNMNIVEPWAPWILRLTWWQRSVPWIFMNMAAFGVLLWWYGKRKNRYVRA